MAEETEKKEKKEKFVEVPIVVPSQELLRLIDEVKYSLNMKSPQMYVPDLMPNTDMSLAVLLDMPPSSRKAFLKKQARDYFNEVKRQLKLTIEQVPELLADASLQLVFNILEQIIEGVVGPIDEIYVQVLTTYNFFVRLFRTLSDPDLREELAEEIKQKLIAYLKDLFMRLPFVAEVLCIIMLIDVIKDTIKTLKDIKNASPERIDRNGKKIKKTEEILAQEWLLGSAIVSTIFYFLQILLPIMLLIGAAFCSSNNYDKALGEALRERDIEDNKRHREILPPNNGATKDENGNWVGGRTSTIIYYAKNNLNGYSYTYYPQGVRGTTGATTGDEGNLDGGNDGALDRLCGPGENIDYFDMCIVDRSGTVGDGELEQLKDAQNIVVEFYEKEPYTIKVKEGETVNYGDVIGEINGAKAKACFDGEILKIDNNIIFVKKSAASKSTEEMTEEFKRLGDNAESYLNVKTEAQKIVDKFTDATKVETILREHFMYLKIPQIPLNIGTTQNTYAGIDNKKTKDEILSIYKEYVKSVMDKHQQNIEYLCGAEHASAMAKELKMDKLKDEIISEKKRFFDSAFDAYDNYLSRRALFSKTRKEDYYLLTDYMEVYDGIEYDEDNEYTVELTKYLADFIAKRSVLEASSVYAAKQAFNEKCDKLLKHKWTYKESYYSKFEKMFKTDYYQALITEPSSNKINPDYKKMYDFLVSLVDCAEEELPTFEFSTMDDLNNMIKGNTSTKFDKKKAEMRAECRAICRKFWIIQLIVNYKKLNKVSDLPDVDIKTQLVNQTKYENEVLTGYFRKLRDKYNGYIHLTDNETFYALAEAVSRKYDTVYYNQVKHEHYFYYFDKPSATMSNDGMDTNRGFPANFYGDDSPEFKEMMDSGASMYTKHDPLKFPYWLLYCAQATLVHCMLPFYWSCGFLIAGAPLPLPVIYIPIYFLEGQMSILFGLGICGIAIYPMIVCINFTIDVRSIIFPLNMLIEKMEAMAKGIVENGKAGLREMVKKEIEKERESSKDYDEEMRKIDVEIADIKEEMVSLGMAKEYRRRKRKEQREARKNKKKNEEK